MTSQIKYNTKEQIFLTHFYIYMYDEHKATYESFNELMDISPSQFSTFIKSFKQMITDLNLKCVFSKETIKQIDYETQFGTNVYYLTSLDDISFEYEHLNEEQLIKYSMTIVYLMLLNHQYVTTALLKDIFPNFDKQTMFYLINKLKEIVPGDIDKNELFSYVLEID